MSRNLILYIGLSILVHLLVFFSIGRLGSYKFSSPVELPQAVMIDLKKTDLPTPAKESEVSGAENATVDQTEDEKGDTDSEEEVDNVSSSVADIKQVQQPHVETKDISKIKNDADAEPTETAKPHIKQSNVIKPPLRSAGEFMAAKSEKLTFLLTLLGMPVGTTELEANNEKGEVRITLRTMSNPAMSGLYNVNDVIETRHIAGNFIITKVRQQEGAFRSDIGYTIFLRDKRVFWMDLIKKRYQNETVPTSEVLDTLSSFYYLRKHALVVGKTETLHVYDGETFADIPIKVLRSEEIRLRNFTKVDTLLLSIAKKDGGILRNSGTMLIWVTNDENRVPVRIETTIAIGKLTADLISAE